MSYQGKLNSYIERVQQRLRLGASVRGAAMLTAAALITTVVLVVILNAFGFPKHGLPGARAALIILLAVTARGGVEGVRITRAAVGWALATAVMDTSGNLLFIAATRAGRGSCRTRRCRRRAVGTCAPTRRTSSGSRESWPGNPRACRALS